VAVKVPGRQHGGGHHFGIAHWAVGVFVMMKCFQDVVTPTVNDYDLIVHGVAPVVKSGLQENALWTILAFSTATFRQLGRYR
jgi:hypothetical protein